MDDGTYGRHGFCSSSSWLDGVPFKVGPKFRPPPKVIYQPVIQNSTRNPNDEYTFETEEAVLAWAKAREEALKKASIEQAEKALKTKNDNAEHPENEINQENVTNIKDGNNSAPFNSVTNSGQGNAVAAKAKPPQVAAKPLIPKKLPEPGAILKPTPIQHLNKASNQNGSGGDTKPSSNSVVDVSMFESVADPFDTLELQTIDDMEELKVLLDTASSSNDIKKDGLDQSNSENNSSDSSQNVGSTEGIYALAAPVSMDTWEKFEDNTLPSTNRLQNNLNALQEPIARGSESPVSDDIGEYVDIAEETCLNSKAVNGIAPVEMTKPDSSNLHSPALPGNNMSKLNSAKGIYKPVLPPIPHNHINMLNGESATDSLEQNSSVQFPTTATVSMGTSSVSFSNTPCPPSVSTDPKPVRPAPLPPTILNRHVPKPSPRNSPRQPQTNCFETDFNSADEHIANPYSRHSTNPGHSDAFGSSPLTDPNGPTQSPMNQLNRYSPLPPAPAPKPKEIGLTDPYHSLSRESQEFVDRVTSMGFRRAKVARAVEKFGQDEKEVLDHLFAVDMLVEKKYAPIHAEAALQSCKNDLDKAEEFLKLQVQLEQLGFNSETVRDALISSGMDHDKALDILTT